MPLPTELDADELLQLAIAASDRDQTDQAIVFLKRATQADPGHAKAHYLLGAEHAQIGLFDRAIEEMGTAVALDPELHPARFQLGLLLLTSRRVAEAETTWAGLTALGSDHYYPRFAAGLLHLARDEFQASVEALTAGLTTNQENAPLNRDMAQVLQQVEQLRAQQPAAAGAEAETQADDTTAGHFFLSAYASRPQ